MGKSITQVDIEKSVKISQRGALVRSDVLAKMFGRTHKQVLATIRAKNKFLEENSISLGKYFIEEIGTKPQGGSFTRYQLTRRGFDLVALSLKGKQADIYKLWYIEGYHNKQDVIDEHKLVAKTNTLDEAWKQFRQEGIEFRNKLTKAIHDTVEVYRNDVEKKMNDGKYYYHYTSLIYSVLGIDLPKGTNPRDVLDKRMLVRLEDMEDTVADMIVDSNEYYKDTYKTIKQILTKYISHKETK